MQLGNVVKKSCVDNTYSDRKLISSKKSFSIGAVEGKIERSNKSQNFLSKQLIKAQEIINRQKHVLKQHRINESVLVPRLKINNNAEVNSSRVLGSRQNESLNNCKKTFDERLVNKAAFRESLHKKSNRSFSQMRGSAVPKFLNVQRLCLCARRTKGHSQSNSSRIVYKTKEHSNNQSTNNSTKYFTKRRVKSNYTENVNEISIKRIELSTAFKTRRDIINMSRIRQCPHNSKVKSKVVYDLIKSGKLNSNSKNERQKIYKDREGRCENNTLSTSLKDNLPQLQRRRRSLCELQKELNITNNEMLVLYPKISIGHNMLKYNLSVMDCSLYQLNEIVQY
eukprot:TRINITY_DN10414_c0_g1_i4.p1 TRINITY_DN10414_c0_g1~~TRINITY_DN10414_c0_g1_i4.p1  ORF type:complete len:338 (-),score=33.13 TRINITY_DN10414_c0_g1_i4:96-1109(-)